MVESQSLSLTSRLLSQTAPRRTRSPFNFTRSPKPTRQQLLQPPHPPSPPRFPSPPPPPPRCLRPARTPAARTIRPPPAARDTPALSSPPARPTARRTRASGHGRRRAGPGRTTPSSRSGRCREARDRRERRTIPRDRRDATAAVPRGCAAGAGRPAAQAAARVRAEPLAPNRPADSDRAPPTPPLFPANFRISVCLGPDD